MSCADDLDLLRAWLTFRLWQKCAGGEGDVPKVKQAAFIAAHLKDGKPTLLASEVSELVNRRNRRPMSWRAFMALVDIFGDTLEKAMNCARDWKHDTPGRQWLAGGYPKVDDLPNPSRNLMQALERLASMGNTISAAAYSLARWRLVEGDLSPEEWGTLLIRYMNTNAPAAALPRLKLLPPPKPTKRRSKVAEDTRNRSHSTPPPPRPDRDSQPSRQPKKKRQS